LQEDLLRMDDLTRKLAEYAVGFRPESLSAALVETIGDHIIDAVGCAIAAVNEAPARIARSVAAESEGARVGASVIGLAARVPPDQAAFCNSVMSRCLDFNDTFNGNRTGGHPSDMLAGILAAAECAGIGGRAVINGMFIAYEVFGALADEVALREYAVDQGAFLSVAVASAIAGTHHFTREQAANAISLALTTTMPLRASRSGELSEWKGCATGHSVGNAVAVVRLAQRGMQGPPHPFRGVDGFLQRVPVALTLDRLGQPSDGKSIMERTSIKFLPVEWGAQAPVELFLKLRARLPIDKIKSIDIAGYDFLVKEIGGGRNDAKEKWDPQTRETADHSLPYLLAIALMDGDVTLASFSPERVSDPELRPLMQKMTVTLDPATKTLPPPRQPVRFKIELNDGTVIEETCEYPLGHPMNPAGRDAVHEKFLKLTEPVLGGVASARLLSRLRELAVLPRLDDLMADLRGVAAR
jgi:2-methylcitrate dehydratase